jgi:hypothetical protein
MALVVLIQNAVNAEDFLVYIAEGFKLLGMCRTILRAAVYRLIRVHYDP